MKWGSPQVRPELPLVPFVGGTGVGVGSEGDGIPPLSPSSSRGNTLTVAVSAAPQERAITHVAPGFTPATDTRAPSGVRATDPAVPAHCVQKTGAAEVTMSS